MEEVQVQDHIRLVHWMARKYGWSGSEYDELVSAGIEGLLVAKGRFDPTRGYKFVTYATWWVRSYIQKAVNRHIKENHASLDVEDENGRRWIDNVEADPTEDSSDMDSIIRLLIATLPHREQTVIGRRYGVHIQIPSQERKAIENDVRQELQLLKSNV